MYKESKKSKKVDDYKATKDENNKCEEMQGKL